LRQGIHLRGYAQKNPKQEYKREAFELFSQMLDLIKNDVVRTVVTVRIQSREEAKRRKSKWRNHKSATCITSHDAFDENNA
jgi:preprotein translocase subunit SecA